MNDGCIPLGPVCRDDGDSFPVNWCAAFCRRSEIESADGAGSHRAKTYWLVLEAASAVERGADVYHSRLVVRIWPV